MQLVSIRDQNNIRGTQSQKPTRREKARGERIDEGSEKKRRKEKREKGERVCMRGRRERMNEKYDYMNEKERIMSFIGENIFISYAIF